MLVVVFIVPKETKKAHITIPVDNCKRFMQKIPNLYYV